ncbi:MAG: alpha/beta fold hydrolase [Acidobacteriota bacterium]
MQTLILTAIRWTLRLVAVVSPRRAGRMALRLFRTPRGRRPVPRQVGEVMARAERLGVDVDGHRVVAYRWSPPAGAAGSGRVLLAHGWESRAARLAVWVEPLLAAGFEVIAFDAPAHGDSEGRRTDPTGFVAAIDAVVARCGAPTVAVGHSLGALSLLLATSAGDWLGRPNLDLERLVVVAGADSGRDAMAMFCRVLGLGDSFLPLILDAAAVRFGHPVTTLDGHRVFAARHVPTLWLHDPADDEVPLAAAERVAAACPHVQLERVDGLGHHRIARDPGSIRRGVEFLSAPQTRPVAMPQGAAVRPAV